MKQGILQSYDQRAVGGTDDRKITPLKRKKNKNSAKDIKAGASPVLVAHTCNPSYSGDRNQEDCCSKPAWANSL
jgi:hypothetical protein